MEAPRFFRKRPVVVEAIQWTGGNSDAVKAFGGYSIGPFSSNFSVTVKILEGSISAYRGDWIIKDINGTLSKCRPDIFSKTYEEVVVDDGST